MNVVVANKYQTLLANLNIEVMKTMYGEYDVEEIISTFQTFFYNRMILDITAIRNHEDIRVIQKLSISLDMSKVILLLDDSGDSSSREFYDGKNFIDTEKQYEQKRSEMLEKYKDGFLTIGDIHD